MPVTQKKTQREDDVNDFGCWCSEFFVLVELQPGRTLVKWRWAIWNADFWIAHSTALCLYPQWFFFGENIVC